MHPTLPARCAASALEARVGSRRCPLPWTHVRYLPYTAAEGVGTEHRSETFPHRQRERFKAVPSDFAKKWCALEKSNL